MQWLPLIRSCVLVQSVIYVQLGQQQLAAAGEWCAVESMRLKACWQLAICWRWCVWLTCCHT
jgi:hypothetical protein